MEDLEDAEESPLLSELRKAKDRLVRNCGLEIDNRNAQIHKEEEIMSFVPTGELKKESGIGEELRFIEEEGFYVGERPAMALKNVERVKERLINQTPAETVSDWFDESGQPLALPDPLRPRPLRILPSSTSEKQIIYRKAAVEGSKGVVEANEEIFRLELTLGRLQFFHHHLFSQEHVYASKLVFSFNSYADWLSRDLISYWRQQLSAIRLAFAEVSNQLARTSNDGKNNDELAELQRKHDIYASQVTFVRKQLNNEYNSEMSLYRSIISSWKALKDHRKSVGYIVTGWKLVIARETVDPSIMEKEVAEWQRDFEDEVEETFIATSRALLTSVTDGGNENVQPVAPDIDAIRSQVHERLTTQRRQPGSPKLSFDLQANGVSVTPAESLPAEERNRRHEVTRT